MLRAQLEQATLLAPVYSGMSLHRTSGPISMQEYYGHVIPGNNQSEKCSATWRKGQEQITSGALYDRRPRHDRADRVKSDEYDPLPRGNRSHRAKGKLLTEDLSISIGLTANYI